MRTLVIVPTYNERENLEELVASILPLDPELDILVVDDNSPDGTGRLADLLANAEPRVRVLHRSRKMGLASAYLDGFRHGLARGYDYLVEMDADFSHRPADLPRLLGAMARADVAIGSRNVRGGRTENWSPLRKALSQSGSLYARLLLGVPVYDLTSGFKCFRRWVLEQLNLEQVRSAGYGFQIELNVLCHRAGCKMVEVPIVFPDRRAGRSKMSWRIVLEAAAVVWSLRQREGGANQSTVSRAQGTAQLSATIGSEHPTTME